MNSASIDLSSGRPRAGHVNLVYSPTREAPDRSECPGRAARSNSDRGPSRGRRTGVRAACSRPGGERCPCGAEHEGRSSPARPHEARYATSVDRRREEKYEPCGRRARGEAELYRATPPTRWSDPASRTALQGELAARDDLLDGEKATASSCDRRRRLAGALSGPAGQKWRHRGHIQTEQDEAIARAPRFTRFRRPAPARRGRTETGRLPALFEPETLRVRRVLVSVEPGLHELIERAALLGRNRYCALGSVASDVVRVLGPVDPRTPPRSRAAGG